MKDLVGPYRIESPLGHGGMGIVYLGVHDHLGREVAIKALAPELTRHPEFRERFFAEARVQARLQHSNIVTIYDLIEDEGNFFIVMEHVPGRTLEALLAEKDGQAWNLDRSLSLFRQILAGLDYAHSKGVIHRDVKPSNVLVSDGDVVKLTDFGIALLIGDKRLTASRSTIGTPTYMSPEQILRPRSVDHRSDVYSAAVVLYEMLAGQPPFDAETEYEIKKLQIEAPVPDIRELKKGIPTEIAEALTVTLRKRPEERFQSAGAFLRALQGSRTEVTTVVHETTEAVFPQPAQAPDLYAGHPLAEEETEEPRKDSFPRHASRQTWRHPVALGGAAAALLTLLASLGLFLRDSGEFPQVPLEISTAASPQEAAALGSPTSAPDLTSDAVPASIQPSQDDPPRSAQALTEPPPKPVVVEPTPSPPPTEPNASQAAFKVAALARRQLQVVRQEIEREEFEAARKDLDLLRTQVADLPSEHRELRESIRQLDQDLLAAVLAREKRQEKDAGGWSRRRLQQARTYVEQGQPQRGRELAQDLLADTSVPEDVAQEARVLIENLEREAGAELVRPSLKDRENAIRQSGQRPSDGLLLRIDDISGSVPEKGKVTFQVRYTVLGLGPNEEISLYLTAGLQRSGGSSAWIAGAGRVIAVRQGGGTLETPVVLEVPSWLGPGKYIFTVTMKDQYWGRLEKKTATYEFVVVK